MTDADDPRSGPRERLSAWLLRTARRRELVDGAIALTFTIAYAAILIRTTSNLGYARDEGFYFQAAHSYARWFEQLLSNWRAAIEPKAVDAAWGVNHEHPGLIKSLFAISNLVLQRKLGLFAMEGTSFRFPGIALAGAGIGLVYLWGAQARGRVAGASAAVLLAAMPRFFYHAHLACFDVPIVTMWMLCAYCYWRSLLRDGWAWPIATGIAFGLALDTKHNSWFLPIVLTSHAALVQIRARVIDPRLAEGTAGGAVGTPSSSHAWVAGRRSFAALASMAVLGPLVMYALWPWIWRDTLNRLWEYASFHLNHEYYNMEFLGRNYWTPPMPRGYAPVMTAATVPTVTLLLAVAGLCARARARLSSPVVRLIAALRPRVTPLPPMPRPDPGSTDLLWLLSFAAAYSAWLSPSTPIFGGTKHWMTAYPFLALFAGAGFAEVVTAARLTLARAARSRVTARPRKTLASIARGPWPLVAAFAGVAAAPIVETARSHPWGLSSYTPLVGGAAGAATLGLNRTFWGYTTGAVVDYLNREVGRGGTVYIHDTAWPSWEMLLRDGRLRKDIRGVWSVADASFGLYHHELHMLGQEYQNWVAFKTVVPAYVGGFDGVPVILVYRRPTLSAAPRR